MLINIFYYGLFFVKIIFLFAVLLLSALAFYHASKKILLVDSSQALFASSLFAGPLIISYITIYFLGAFGKNYFLYIVFIIALCLLVLFFCLERKEGFFTKRAFLTSFSKFSNFDLVFLGGIIILSLAIADILFILPPHGNDSLEYFQLARHIYESGRLAQYPLMDPTLARGFLAPWTHPPGYVGLLTFAFIIQGQAIEAGVAKFVSFWFYIALIIQIICFFPRHQRSFGIMAASLFIITPFYIDITLLAHIDIIRLSGIMAGANALLVIYKTPIEFTRRSHFALGWFAISLGLMLFTHSISIIVLPIIVALYYYLVFLREEKLTKLFITAGILTVLSLAIIAPQLISNYRMFGSFIQDNVAIWAIPQLDIKNFLEATRFINTPADKIIFGIFAPFFSINLFGIFNLLSLIPLSIVTFWLLRNFIGDFSKLQFRLKTTTQRFGIQVTLSVLFIFMFLSMAALTVLAGSTLVIKNARYLLTIQPFCSILAAYFIRALYISLNRKIGKGFKDSSFYVAAYEKIKNNPKGNLVFRFMQFLTFFLKKTYLLRRAAIVTLLLLIPFTAVTLSSVITRREVFINYNVGPRTLLDPENIKRESMNWAVATLEKKLRQISNKNDVILTYRQSDTGFFTENPFIVYFDERMIPFYHTNSKEDAYRILKNLKVKYIFLPNYPIAEISNSIASPLFSDSTYVNLQEESEGWKLLELRDAPIAVTKNVIAEWTAETGLKQSSAISQPLWKTIAPLSTYQRLIERREAIQEVPPKEVLHLKMHPSLVTRPNKFTYATTGVWHDDAIDNAFLTRIHDFIATDGAYNLTAVIEGNGLFQMQVRTDTVNDIVYTPELKTVWSGVLSKNEIREITSSFKIEQSLAHSATTSQTLGQIIFSAHHRADVKVKSWRLEKINIVNNKNPFKWEMVAGNNQIVQNLRPNTGFPALKMQQVGSNGAYVLSPQFLPQFSSSERVTVNNENHITIKTRLSGSSLTSLSALVACDTVLNDPQKYSEKLLTKQMRKSKVSIFEDDFITYKLGEAYAYKTPQVHEFNFNAFCRPNKIILKYTLNGVATPLNNYLRNSYLIIDSLDVSLTEKRGDKIVNMVYEAQNN